MRVLEDIETYYLACCRRIDDAQKSGDLEQLDAAIQEKIRVEKALHLLTVLAGDMPVSEQVN